MLRAQTGCGLVMKEDITQLHHQHGSLVCGCGLVMKEDITQRGANVTIRLIVVVW